MSIQNESSSCILLTGTTGFLGKVVLEELFRRREEFQFDRVIITIRPKRGQDARSRFLKELVSSPCFANLPTKWTDSVHVIEADLREKSCGIDKLACEELYTAITHIIHCAGSIQFNLPLAAAATSNITSTLNMYDFAQRCPNLEQLVITSTAYVTSHTSAPIYEVLAPLPRPAAELLEDIRKCMDPKSEDAFLRYTGFPNTYTLTKCIAEHLIMERKGGVPVTIVRPSIISASMEYPSPGWIDSPAAVAAVLIARIVGALRVLDVDLTAVVDIVPVDHVARTLIDEALLRNKAVSTSKIVYAVATLKHGMLVDAIRTGIDTFCNRKQGYVYWGSRNLSFYIHEFLLHKVRLSLAGLYYACCGNQKMQRQMEGASKLVYSINRLFPYFVNNTFDFRPKIEVADDFDSAEYFKLMCLGVEKHLLSKL